MRLFNSLQYRFQRFKRQGILNKIKSRRQTPESLASDPVHGVSVWEYNQPQTLTIDDDVEMGNLSALPVELHRSVGDLHFPQPYVAELQNAHLISHRIRNSERFFTLAITQSGQIVEETTSGKQQTYGEDFVWDRLKTEEMERILHFDYETIGREFDTAFIITPERAFYYPLLAEIIPRFEGLEHYASVTGHTPTILIPDGFPSYFQQYVELFGYPYENYSLETSSVKRLVVPSWRQQGMLTSSETIAWMQQRLLPAVAEKRKDKPPFDQPYIYVTRRKVTRRIVNEDELFETCLDDAGFVPFVLEDMPVIDQIALMNQAKFVVGPHGGGFSNLLFCQPGTSLLEMFSETWVYEYFFGLAKAIRMPYGFMVNKVDSEDRAIVNIDDFRAVFDPMFERHLAAQ